MSTINISLMTTPSTLPAGFDSAQYRFVLFNMAGQDMHTIDSPTPAVSFLNVSPGDYRVTATVIDPSHTPIPGIAVQTINVSVALTPFEVPTAITAAVV